MVDEVYELFLDLGADEKQIDFPIVYTNGKAGTASLSADSQDDDLSVLFDVLRDTIPAPEYTDGAPLQALVTNLAADSYLGRLAICRVHSDAPRSFDRLFRRRCPICQKNHLARAYYALRALPLIHEDAIQALRDGLPSAFVVVDYLLAGTVLAIWMAWSAPDGLAPGVRRRLGGAGRAVVRIAVAGTTSASFTVFTTTCPVANVLPFSTPFRWFRCLSKFFEKYSATTIWSNAPVPLSVCGANLNGYGFSDVPGTYKSDTLIGYECTITAYPGTDNVSVLRLFKEGWELPEAPTP